MSKNLSAKYYQENKDYKRKLARDFSKEGRKETKKKRQYGRERYKNLSENKKNKLVEYRKKYYRMRKLT